MAGRTAAVTYEQVEAVANRLYTTGNKNPSARNIRDEMVENARGRGQIGSLSTIQGLLVEWRKLARPMEPVVEPKLPPHLLAYLADAMSKIALEAEARKQMELDLAHQELAELVVSAQANEARLEELTRDVIARTSERDAMFGQLQDRNAELVALRLAQSQAQSSIATMGSELNAARAEAMTANARVEEIRQSTDGLKMQVLSDLEHARTNQDKSAREAAECAKQCAALEARVEGQRETRRALEQREADLQSKLQRLEDVTARAQVAEATSAGLREQNLALQGTIKFFETMLQGRTGGHSGPTGADAIRSLS